MKVTMIREIVETAHSGDNSVKTHQAVGAEVTFLTENGEEPKVKNPQYSDVGEWKIIKP
jgi:hypothetical protein